MREQTEALEKQLAGFLTPLAGAPATRAAISKRLMARRAKVKAEGKKAL